MCSYRRVCSRLNKFEMVTLISGLFGITFISHHISWLGLNLCFCLCFFFFSCSGPKNKESLPLAIVFVVVVVLDVVVNLCQLKIICHGYQQQLRKQRMAKVEWGIVGLSESRLREGG